MMSIDILKIKDSIASTMAKCDCAMTDSQETILAGALGIWLEKYAEDKLQAARQSAQEPAHEPVYFLLTSANQYCEVDKLVYEMAKPEYRRKLYTKLEDVYDQAIAKAQNRPLADVFEEYEAMLEQAIAKEKGNQ